MGNHSGYEKVCDVLAAQNPIAYRNTYRPRHPLRGPIRRGVNYLARDLNTSQTYTSESAYVELKALWQSCWHRSSLIHVLYVERMLGLLAKWQNHFPYDLIATAHQPVGLWRMGRHNPDMLRPLDGLIVLSSREVSFFETYLPDRVHLILHGVDTEFFCPSPSPIQTDAPRFVFSGTWLRDLDTLVQVVETTLARDPGIQFDLIVPASKRQQPQFYRIAHYDQVHWCGGLSDHQLRDVYRRAKALLLPLLDCTANNALLESIACGLPIISNDVGGMPDYTRNSFATLLSPRDIQGFVEAILTLAESPEIQAKQGQAARQFAKAQLDWSAIAAQTLNVYSKASLR
ncbi:MAG: glycosyltransferase family 4 protein [Cyanobacteria bacterium P01_G01_bin.38]